MQAATSAPLIERSIERATGIVYNITGGSDLTLQEVNRWVPPGHALAACFVPVSHLWYRMDVMVQRRMQPTAAFIATLSSRWY